MFSLIQRKIGRRLFIAYIIVFLLMGAVTAVAWLRLEQIHDTVDQLIDGAVADLLLAEHINAETLRLRNLANRYVRTQDPQVLDTYTTTFAGLRTLFNRADQQLQTGAQRAELHEVEEEMIEFERTFQAIVVDLYEQERLEEDIFALQLSVLNDDLVVLEAFIRVQDEPEAQQVLNEHLFGLGALNLATIRYLSGEAVDNDFANWPTYLEAVDSAERLQVLLAGTEQEGTVARMLVVLAQLADKFSEMAEIRQQVLAQLDELDEQESEIAEHTEGFHEVFDEQLQLRHDRTVVLLDQTRVLVVVTAVITTLIGLGGIFQLSRWVNLSLEQAATETHLANEKARNQQLVADNVRLHTELDISRRLQEMLLPTEEELEDLAGLDVAGYMQPATEVGGDYYDILSEGQRLKIGIGDVTGHGLESGVLMLMTQVAVRTLLNTQIADPERFIPILNKTIYQNVQRMDSARTLTLALLDYQPVPEAGGGGRLMVSGYHEEVLIMRASGQLERIDTVELGTPIGLVDDVAGLIQQVEVVLRPGDGVVLYTDGITEAEDGAEQMYGLDRLGQILQANWSRPAGEIIEAMVADVARHVGPVPLADDVTLVVLKQE